MIDEVLGGERSWMVLHADCMQTTWALPAGVFDAIVTDPPYGAGYRSKRHGRIRNDVRPYIWWLHDAYRLTKRNAALICFCRWDVQHVFSIAIEAAGFEIQSQVIWDRKYHGGGNTKRQFAPRHDTILFATKGAFEFPDGRPIDVLEHPRIDYRSAEHPTEKPVPVMEKLVTAVAPEGGLILDPCAGVGPTGEAAVRRRRRCVLIEIEARHAATAARRLHTIEPARSPRLDGLELEA